MSDAPAPGATPAAGLESARIRVPEPPSAAEPAQLFPPPAADGSAVRTRKGAALLAFALGAFGVHKFYLGRNRAGFAMMAATAVGGVLTFGMAAIAMAAVGVMEGLAYLRATPAAFERDYLSGSREWF